MAELPAQPAPGIRSGDSALPARGAAVEEEQGKAAQGAGQPAEGPRRYVLRLYVTGSTPRSTKAISNLRRILEQHLPGGYDLQVVDLYQEGGMAQQAQIVAAPTLEKQLPLPLRRLIGDLSNTERVMIILDLPPDGIPDA